MKQTLVSICIPSYRQPKLVKRCLNSILKQEHKNYEVIVTDDSPDNSVEKIVEKFEKMMNLQYLKNNKRKGTPENWNYAMKFASGKYIKIIHHDDWLSNVHSLSKYVDILDHNPDTDFVFSASNAFKMNGKLSFVHSPNDLQIEMLKKYKDILFFGNFIGAPSCTIFRKSSNIVFDNKLKWLVDIDFYIRLLKLNHNFHFIKEPLINITTDGEYQVTMECVNNKCLELSEYYYLYKKITNKKVSIFKYLKFFIDLHRRHDVSSLKDIYSCENIREVPNLVKAVVLFNSIINKK